MAEGTHIKVVGHADPANMTTTKVTNLLNDLVGRIGMQKLGDVVTHDVALDIAALNREPFQDEGGVTGMVVLSTSHAAIHTWPLRNLFVMDVFSCREFHPQHIMDAINEHLGTGPKAFYNLSHALFTPNELRVAAEAQKIPWSQFNEAIDPVRFNAYYSAREKLKTDPNSLTNDERVILAMGIQSGL